MHSSAWGLSCRMSWSAFPFVSINNSSFGSTSSRSHPTLICDGATRQTATGQRSRLDHSLAIRRLTLYGELGTVHAKKAKSQRNCGVTTVAFPCLFLVRSRSFPFITHTKMANCTSVCGNKAS